MSAVIIIPARYASERFPGKPLALILGKPMVQWVWEAAQGAKLASAVIIATDDPQIAQVARGFGATVTLTDTNHTCGTDRVAEVASQLSAQVIINLQGDEPLVEPHHLDTLIQCLLDNETTPMATLAHVGDPILLDSPDIVKVHIDGQGHAVQFSRSAIPAASAPPHYHIGIYGYQRKSLAKIAALPPTENEKAESLEQIRVLDHGLTISVVTVSAWSGVGVDRPQDIARAESALNSRR
jgi:3-deoxy-manno-octulosonate cytidylyltransferase (CMP-KDO synthetase)